MRILKTTVFMLPFVAAFSLVASVASPAGGAQMPLASLSLLLSIVVALLYWKAVYAPLKACMADDDRDDEISLSGLMKRLTELEDSRRALIESLPMAAFEVDEAGSIIYANDEAAGMMGRAADEAKGLNVFDLAPGEGKEALRRLLDAAFLKGAARGAVMVKGGMALHGVFALPSARAGAKPSCLVLLRNDGGLEAARDELERVRKESAEASERLKKTIRDLEDFALIAVRRELKMQEMRETFLRLREPGEGKKEAEG